MNRGQWFQLFIKHNNVQDEIDRLIRLIGPDESGAELLTEMIEGVVQICANIASRIDDQRERKDAAPRAG